MANTENAPIMVNDRMYRKVQEGQASILAPYQKSTAKSKKTPIQLGQSRNNDEGDQAVFYNPIQQYNRDLSVLAILVYGESLVQTKMLKHEKNVHKSQEKKAAAKARHKQLPKPRAPETTATNTGPVLNPGRKRTAEEAGLDEDIESENAILKNPTNGHRDSSEDVEVQELETVVAGKGDSGIKAPKEGQDQATTDDSLHEAEKRIWKPSFTILDALSASGLRAIRYAKEIPFATTVIANDVSSDAVEAIDLNIEQNELKGKVFSHVGDARQFMYSKTGNEDSNQKPGYVHKFDVIDLDPYGTAASFFDGSIQALADGGMLCVTCTDAGVWASNGYPEKAYALYGGIPLKGAHSHEAGLRLILHSIATSASKYGIGIEPLLSLSIDFYARLFIRVHKSQQDVKLMAGTTMLVYNCDQGCGAWQTQPVARNQDRKAKNNETFFKHGFAQAPSADKYCEHCGTKSHLGGPMWSGPLHNPVFVQKLLDRLPNVDKTIYGTTERIRGMLTVALEEEDIDWPRSSPRSTTNINTATQLASEPSSTVNGNTEQVLSLAQTNVSSIIPRMPPQILSPSPLFFLPTYLSKILSLPTPAEDPLRGAILGLGYTCTRSHCKPGSFKTNAPWKVLWEIMREWGRQQESARIPRLLGEGEFEGKASVKKSSPGWNILKRLRNRKGDTLIITKMRESLLQKLGLGGNSPNIDTASDLQGLLKSALYELEHPTKQVDSESGAAIDEANGQASGINSENGQPLPSSTLPLKISGKELIDNGGDPSELDIVFDSKLGRASRESKGGKLVRYQVNPRSNWGPMVRAGSGMT